MAVYRPVVSGGVRGGRGGGVKVGPTQPKVGGACRGSGARPDARPMHPDPLAPLQPRKLRALTTIYAPRKIKPRKNRTAQTRMLDDVPLQQTLTPFRPLPAIGCKKQDKEIIVLDLKKPHDILKPLTPLRIHGYKRQRTMDLDRKEIHRLNSMDIDKPQQLVRENTYDVIKPIFLKVPKVKKRESRSQNSSLESEVEEPKQSPKSRFKKAAMQVAKLSCYPETGKLLCLRERETYKLPEEDEKVLQCLLESPTQKLNKLTEIFQSLDITGCHRDRIKKENSWF